MASDWDYFVWRRASDLLQQAERIRRNFQQFAVVSQYRSWQGRNTRWEPPVNVIETDESLWIISAIAGVTADQVKVRLEGGELIISGERPLPECCKDGELHLWEIPLGRFERRLTLLQDRNALSIGKISLQDGLLAIELRK